MASGIWACPGAPFSPGCPGGEIYAEVTKGRLRERCLFAEALKRCSIEFGRSASSPPRLWLGVRAQAIRNFDGSIDIYLVTQSNDDQFRFQCAQEVFHAVGGPEVIHWTHELLSIHFALQHLRAAGYGSYAAIVEGQLRSAASVISTSELLGWQGWPDYPPADVYGRAFVLGEQLIEATSWDDVKQLISADPTGWLDTLEDARR